MKLSIILLFWGYSLNCVKIETGKFSKEIIGNWKSTSNDEFGSRIIMFGKDSNAGFSSIADTIYHYVYYIRDSNLILRDINWEITKVPIQKLDKDSLIFKSFLGINHIQRYVRGR